MTERTRNKISRIETSLVILLLVSILAVNIYSSRSTWISEVTEISSPSMGSPYETEKTVSYIISKVGSNYYAVNGTTGRTQFYGTNASTLLTSVILALSNAGGGDILIKAGNYPISPRIVLLSNVNIRGEGKATRLYIPAGQPNIDINYAVFRGDNVSNFMISNIQLDGTRASNTWTGSSHGLILVAGSSHDINLEYLYIVEAPMFGIFIFGSNPYTIYNVNTRFCKFINGGMWNSIYYLNYGAGGLIKDCTIEGNDVQGFSDIGICLGEATGGSLEKVSVISNKIHDGVNGYGSGGGTDAIVGIRLEGDIYDCMVAYNQIYTTRFGIATSVTAKSCSYIGNTIRTDMTGSGWNHGIEIEGSDDLVLGNTILGGYVAWAIGIHVTPTGNNVTVSSNKILKAGTASDYSGIQVDTGAKNSTLIGNRMRLCNYDISLGTGTGTKSKDNMGSNNAWIADV